MKKRIVGSAHDMNTEKDKKESDDEKACTDKIAKLEESLKKKKQDDRTFSFLRKTLGSFTKNLVYIWGKLHFPDLSQMFV
ncbi:hypothetical protein L3X38_001637 [Prunus dulcis]|uniref:Uncharacterized protein n=1 Tax=Prunus dulcis TaxID=3755 RepID=A0AAD4WSF7_PRUDU|nr:hypothetical protein L3X38_001637 [Prunus dulcis]